ncbi:MAG: PIG-L family deacetylase [Rhizorhabdus sp.]
MTLLLGHPKRVVIIAPHPDDETIGAWGLMRRLRRSGAAVEVIVVSDGGGSHPASRAWPKPRLIKARMRETRQAMRAIGILPGACTFLRLPDGELAARFGQLQSRLRRTLWRRRAPCLVVGPAMGDAHPDHHAVARALWRSRRRGERRLSYHVWPEGAGISTRSVTEHLGSAAMPAKRRAVLSYRTQTGIIRDAEAGFAMTHRHLRHFVRPRELFTVVP